ncbi:hypothetical protein HK102_002893 [Quaeritorhiza haematococci]|nr:hypothetical protein HK102_002893 [Quaeritorhiza haematococci]
MITGSNLIPVAPRRRFDETNEDQESQAPKRRFEDESTANGASGGVSDEGREGRRKRRSRWGNDESKVNLPGLPTVISATNLTAEQLDAYVIHVRLEEINRKLRSGDVVPPEKERSPSPEPIYGPGGKRINTREARYRKKLEDERHKLVEDGIKKIPGFKPPADYKKPTKLSDKLYIPVRDFPEINFIGLLIGPRGNTLKKMESESGAKISIRGKGSVKEGKSRADGAPAPGEEEDLHCLVMADSEDKIKKAMDMIHKIIETAASVPEGQNELKRQQLRELAALNGTLRDDENQVCNNCGATGHRKFECPEQKNFTINLVCRICNGVGHTARDCMQRNNPEALEAAKEREEKLDSEYASLMAELGESMPPGGGPPPPGPRGHYGPSRDRGGPGPRGDRGGNPPWASGANAAGGSGGPPPWARKDSGSPASSTPTSANGPAPWQTADRGGMSMPPPPGLSSGPPGLSAGPPGMPSGPPSWGAPPPPAYPPSYPPAPPMPPGGSSYYGMYGYPAAQPPPPPPLPFAPPPPPPPADVPPPPPPTQ